MDTRKKAQANFYNKEKKALLRIQFNEARNFSSDWKYREFLCLSSLRSCSVSFRLHGVTRYAFWHELVVGNVVVIRHDLPLTEVVAKRCTFMTLN